MRHYDWDAVPESEMPAVSGRVTRRFVNGERMTVGRVAFTEGAETEPHRHENEQFTTVLSGRMEFTVEGRRVVVREGETLFLASNEWHGARALTAAVVLDVFAPPRADWGPPPPAPVAPGA